MSDTSEAIWVAIGKVFYSRADDPCPGQGPATCSRVQQTTPAPGRILGPEDHYEQTDVLGLIVTEQQHCFFNKICIFE